MRAARPLAGGEPAVHRFQALPVVARSTELRSCGAACRTAWSAPRLLECFASNQRVAGHAVSTVRGGFTTTPEHMPASHRAHRDWTPAKLISWGQRIGVSTAAEVTWQLEHRPHPEQGYRACLGLLALVRRYSADRLEAACTRAMAIRAPNLRSVDGVNQHGR